MSHESHGIPPNSLLLGEILQGAHVASTLGGIVAIRVDGLFFNNEKVTKKTSWYLTYLVVSTDPKNMLSQIG